MTASRSVALLGSTGSVGRQAVEVIMANRERFRTVVIGAHHDVESLAAQAKLLAPEAVAIADAGRESDLRAMLPSDVEILPGEAGMAEGARRAEVVLNAVVGFAGLPVTLAALESGSQLALANKESLVAGAPVVRRARSTPGAMIVPVDSEHCAIHQCLMAGGLSSPTAWPAVEPASLSRLILTSSGGPFRGRSATDLSRVSVAEALRHPTWQMGPKITIDSSTLMNKGLEVLEAHELFGVSLEKIDIVIHPQSVVHSMVELNDGATIAQCSLPDMRLPIGYAMAWPDRLSTPFGTVDWATVGHLDFARPDRSVFRCLDLAYAAGKAGGAAPAFLNGSNEVAVEAFLEGRLAWSGIAAVVEETLAHGESSEPQSLDEVLAADGWARGYAAGAVSRLGNAA